VSVQNYLTARRAEAAVLGLGVVLRVHDFLLGRSLWLDEATLSRNIVERSAADLLTPLDHHQAAPVGFLLAQKAVTLALGNGELALRLLTTVLGVWSLFLFARLSKRLVGPVGALAVLPMFAFNAHVFTATAKQYPVEVWAGLVAATVVWRLTDAAARWTHHVFAAAVGMGLVWVSHSAPLVMAGVGTAVILGHAGRGRWGRAAGAAAVAAGWVASFALVYVVALRDVQHNDRLFTIWHEYLGPRGGSAADYGRWLGRVCYEALGIPLRLSPPQLAAAVIGLGVWSLVRTPSRLAFVALPAVVTLAVSAVGAFPFHGRLVHFLVPAGLWLLAAGFDRLALLPRRAAGVMVGGVLLALLWHPLLAVRTTLLRPVLWEESRPVLEYVAAHADPDDVVFVHPSGLHTFAYYRTLIPFGNRTVVNAALVPRQHGAQEVLSLPPGRRVWVFASELPNGDLPLEALLTRDEVAALLTQAGREVLDTRTAPGVRVVLFSAAR
jgi:hypothetical protein